LLLASVNAHAAGIRLHAVQCDSVRDIPPDIDPALANPPYIIDEDDRQYRDGGTMLGGALSLRAAEEVIPLLAPGGRLILYTGSAIVDRRDDWVRRFLLSLKTPAASFAAASSIPTCSARNSASPPIAMSTASRSSRRS
jgi:methylase of polypeptide subunit release factors